MTSISVSKVQKCVGRIWRCCCSEKKWPFAVQLLLPVACVAGGIRGASEFMGKAGERWRCILTWLLSNPLVASLLKLTKNKSTRWKKALGHEILPATQAMITEVSSFLFHNENWLIIFNHERKGFSRRKKKENLFEQGTDQYHIFTVISLVIIFWFTC